LEEEIVAGKYGLFVFSNPAGDREDEYNDWYNTVHLRDVVSIPGYCAAQRFKRQVLVFGDVSHRYLAIYEMDCEGPEAVADAVQALLTTPMELSGALDAEGVACGVFEICAPHVAAPGQGPTGSFRMVAIADAVESREDEFNHWYNNIHMPEVTSVTGFPWADRYRLNRALGGDFKCRYLSVYGMEANTTVAATEDVKRLAASPLQRSEASASTKASLLIYEICSPRVTGSA
jgi:hypothetical protein